jgi:SAM-dependent methyltransferase
MKKERKRLLNPPEESPLSRPHLHVCPFWVGYLLLNPLRRILQNPRALLEPHVHPGMVVLEPGCAMGFFTLDLARLVGERGRVVAVDLQERMLAALARRAARARLSGRIETRRVEGSRLGVEDLEGKVDFVLAFYLVHELPDQGAFFAEVVRTLAHGGRVLVAEPRRHVEAGAFERSLELAARVGLVVLDRPRIRSSHAALLGPRMG